MKAFLYARVSTKDKGQDVENQLAQLREFAIRMGWTIVHVYIDHESGSTDDRAEFKAMMLAASQHKAHVVLFWALDRLTREGALPTLQYLNTLTSYGVAFKSFTEQYLDSCGIFKDAVISILATIAKQERQRMRERVIAGMSTAKDLLAQGLPTRKGKIRWAGRPRLLIERDAVRRLKQGGMSMRAIGRMMKISDRSVRRLLESPKVRQKPAKKRPNK